jgi:elongation factor Ts
MITTEQIKELRDKTGISVMQCKKALEESGGDMAKALEVLKKKSQEMAAKKADRAFGAGTIASYVHSSAIMGTIVELVAETDFVSGNEEFKALARDIAMHITAVNPESPEALLEQPFIKNPDMTIRAMIDGAMQKFGEKIEISRFVRFGVLEK